MKFKSLSRLLPLVVGSAAAGVLASMAPAKALVFNVGGTNYDVTTVTTTYDASSAQLQATPWWGNSTLAQQLATAVSGSMGQLAPSQFTGYGLSPFFAYFLNTTDYSVPLIFSKTNLYGEGVFTYSQSTYALGSVVSSVPFDIPGGATIPAVGSLLALGAMRKARKSIASKTRIANPVVTVS